jgi:hypothetical protein
LTSPVISCGYFYCSIRSTSEGLCRIYERCHHHLLQLILTARHFGQAFIQVFLYPVTFNLIVDEPQADLDHLVDVNILVEPALVAPRKGLQVHDNIADAF